MKAKIIEPNEENYNICAKRLNNNKLVSIPTETVYGLAANALSIESCNKIFEMKKRPKTDPLIVHVLDYEEALNYFNINKNEQIISKLLTDNFWPGPLTLIMRKNSKINNILTNNSEFVGIRSPNNPIARKLLKISKLPIAAPSANLFCHISPTTSQHVYDDFKNEDLLILEGGDCDIGMESTIIKIDNKTIDILRFGGINKDDLNNILIKLPFKINPIKDTIKKINKKSNKKNIISPGQFIKHYAPNCDSFLFENINIIYDKINNIKKEVVLIDFGKEYRKDKWNFLFYFDLSKSGDIKIAMKNFYKYLREAENIKNVKLILVSFLGNKRNIIKKNKSFIETILDKQLRSCSGKFIN